MKNDNLSKQAASLLEHGCILQTWGGSRHPACSEDYPPSNISIIISIPAGESFKDYP
jgi:hypothetical protein